MSYLVLARKYRPRTFAEIVGQAHILQALSHAFSQNRLHHAYLFTGTRGVGKTSIARIFAKCLNCDEGISATPCSVCATCREIDEGRYIDLLEIDAASRTKVEDTRELLDNVQYSPQRGRYKIYLIDEVHMLSNHSFNALLKTLEEPPAHVKFLLATTDPKRLPVTVLSRCLQFHLQSMTPSQITAQLALILKKEAIPYETPALEALAKAAKGSMRDALSLLDEAIAYGNGELKSDDIIQMLGLTDIQQIVPLINSLVQKDAARLLQVIDTLSSSGADFLGILDELLIIFQEIAVIQLTGTRTESNSPDFTHLAKEISPEDIQLYYQIGLLGKRDLPLAPTPETGFKMLMLRMLAFTPASMSLSITTKNAPETAIDTQVSSLGTKNTKETKASEKPTDLAELNNWPLLVSRLNLTGLPKLLANNCTLQLFNKQEICLLLDESQKALLNPIAKEKLVKALQDYVGNTCNITIDVGKSSTETPAKLQQRETDTARRVAEERLLSEPEVQTLIEKFSATLQSTTTAVSNDSTT